MSTEYKIKQQCSEIIRQAYPGEEFNERYLWFKLKFSSKILKSKSGHYNMKTHEIVIFNLKDKQGNNIVTLLHEVAHHLEYVQNRKCGHGTAFYAAYRRLIHAALDCGAISEEELQSIDRRNTDYNKVMDIVDLYKPIQKRLPGLCEDSSLVLQVKNGFNFKEALKVNKYHWNGMLKVWEKDILKEKLAEEMNLLETMGIPTLDIEQVSSTKMALKMK